MGWNWGDGGDFISPYVPIMARNMFSNAEVVGMYDCPEPTDGSTNIYLAAKQFIIPMRIQVGSVRTEWVADSALRTRVLIVGRNATTNMPGGDIYLDTGWNVLSSNKDIDTYAGSTSGGSYRFALATSADIFDSDLYWQLVFIQSVSGGAVNYTRGSSIRANYSPDADLIWSTAGSTGIANASYATIDTTYITNTFLDKATTSWSRAANSSAWHNAVYALECNRI